MAAAHSPLKNRHIPPVPSRPYVLEPLLSPPISCMSKAEYLKPLEKLSQLWEKGHCLPPPAILPLLAVITVLFQYSNEQFPYVPASPCSVMYDQHQHIHGQGEFTSLSYLPESSCTEIFYYLCPYQYRNSFHNQDSPQMRFTDASVGLLWLYLDINI